MSNDCGVLFARDWNRAHVLRDQGIGYCEFCAHGAEA